MKYFRTAMVVGIAAVIAGCGSSGNNAMGGGTTTPPVTTTTPPSVFSDVVVELALGNTANSDTALPLEIETTAFASLDDETPTRYDGVFTSTP